ncbi:MAG: hypothetical protein A3F80_02050 [Candidatus Melainabacteria bacterium RIFCSPLOWO2_12_FULL_35_11]|nr:MAG: hypothetical protein A3F80_02050 [Candidatus Melainabacteria bacterium RIFCSPLOWO2_12_FULL_35_11]
MGIDSTNIIGFPFRPIGFRLPDGKAATLEEIKKWKEKENPNIVQEQSFLTLAGVVGTVVGLVASLIGFKKDNSLGKWIGIGLTALGIVGAAVGKFMGIDLEKIKEIVDQEKHLEEIKKDITILKDESLRTVPREEALYKLAMPENYPEGLEAVFDFISNSTGDKNTHSLRGVALPMLIDIVKGKDKQRFIDILLNRIQDPNDNSEVHEAAAYTLGEIADEKRVLEILNKLLESEKGSHLGAKIVIAIGGIKKRVKE